MDTLALSGATFLERAGERDLAIAQLERAYAVAPTEEARQQIAAKLRRLHAQEALSRVERVHRYLFERFRQESPFTSQALFMVVGTQRDVAGCAGLTGDTPRCDVNWGVGATALAPESP
jgi:hypothetical protein